MSLRITAAGLLAVALSAPAHAQPPDTAPAPRPKLGLELEFRPHDITFQYYGAGRVTPAPRAKPAPCCEAACPAPAVAVVSAAKTDRPLGTWYKEVPGAVVSLAFGPGGDTLTAKVSCNCDGTVATVTLTADCAATKDGTVHGVVTGGDVEVADGKDLPGTDPDTLSTAVQTLVDQPFAFRCRPADGGLMVGGIRVAGSQPVSADMVPPAGLLAGKFKHAADGQVPAPKPGPTTTTGPGTTNPLDLVQVPQVFAPDAVSRVAGQRFGVDFAVNVPTAIPCPAVAGRAAPCPAVLPGDIWDVMVGTFDEMLNGPRPAAPFALNVLPGQYVTGPATELVACPPQAAPPCPTVRFAAPVPCPVVAAPCPAPPTVAPVAYTLSPTPAPVAGPNPLPAGTWYREVGPVRMTLAVKDGTLTLTTTMTAEADGKTVTQGLLVTADCYPTRDGLVGVVTGADVILDGELPDAKAEDITKGLAEVGKVQKALADKPFALSCRVVNGHLMVSNVRLAVAKADGSGPLDGLEDGILIAGRYKPAGDGGPPAQKPLKTGTAAGKPVAAGALAEAPQYSPDPNARMRNLGFDVAGPAACPVAPEPRAAACPADRPCPGDVAVTAVETRTGAFLVGGSVVTNKPTKLTAADVVTLTKAGLGDEVIVTQLRVTESTFALTVADLVALKKAGVSDAVIVEMQIGDTDKPTHLTPERIHGGIMLNHSSTDPNVRVRQLLYQSENIRPIGEPLRQSCFREPAPRPSPAPDPRFTFSFGIGMTGGGR